MMNAISVCIPDKKYDRNFLIYQNVYHHLYPILFQDKHHIFDFDYVVLQMLLHIQLHIVVHIAKTNNNTSNFLETWS